MSEWSRERAEPEGEPVAPRSAASGPGKHVPGRRRFHRTVEALLVAAAFVVVAWFFHWTVSANGGFADGGDGDYYRLLVRGWRNGQLALAKEPSPGMLALADPYDPKQNAPHRLPDASYYRGKYYLYFGAAPAFTLMLPYTVITGREMTTGAAVWVFCVVAFGAASGLWLAIRRRYFPASALLTAPLGVLGLGFGTHLLALAGRPMFWELPIAAGNAFTALAVLAVFAALHSTRPRWAMAAAGLCLGLAVGSRPTCVLAAPILLAPLWWTWRSAAGAARWRSVLRLGVAAAVPLGLCGLALMGHNYARFQNPLEFGQHYQLSGAYEGKLQHFSLRFVPHNAAVYFLQRPHWTAEFPFVSAPSIQTDLRGYFGTEEVAGLAVSLPFVWFALGLPLLWRARPRDDSARYAAVLFAVAGYAGPVVVFILSYFSSTARYQADFALAFGVVAALGLLAVEAAARPRLLRQGVVGFAAVLVGITVVMGAALALDYHGRALRRTNPPRWRPLEARADAAVGKLGVWLHAWEGPRVVKVRFPAAPAGTIETFWRSTDVRAEERIVIEHVAPQQIRFGYVRRNEPPRWGRVLGWEPNHTHTVIVQAPSLYPTPPGRWQRWRPDDIFCERTGVAVWFSGGRALDAIVESWPAPIVGGGEVDPRFTGEVRAVKRRPFHREDVRDALVVKQDGGPGGVLELDVLLPDELAPEGEPLFASGALYGSDMVFLRPAPGGFKVVFEHFGYAQHESAVLPALPRARRISLSLPTFARGETFGRETRGPLVVSVDGVAVLRRDGDCYGFYPGTEAIGRNPLGTTCRPKFRGWILDARWRSEP